jgi:hypothetical protein
VKGIANTNNVTRYKLGKSRESCVNFVLNLQTSALQIILPHAILLHIGFDFRGVIAPFVLKHLEVHQVQAIASEIRRHPREQVSEGLFINSLNLLPTRQAET